MRCSGRPRSATTSRTASRSLVAGHLDLDDARGHAGAGRPRAASARRRARRGRADVDGEHAGALEQRAGGAGHDEAAAVEHHHVVADLLHVVEQVGGEQHRDAERAEAGDQGQHLLAAHRVEAGGGLVEQHELAGRPRAPGPAWSAGACRWRSRRSGRNRASSRPDQVEHVRGPLAGGPGGQPAQLAEGGDDVGGGLVEREAVVLGHVADAAAHPDRVVRPRRCRTPRGAPRSGGSARASSGTGSSCRRRWPRPARRGPRGTSRSRWSVAVTAG